MERVVSESHNARSGFEADPVHDLRVAIRRCRAVAEVFRAVDPDPAWKKMRAAGKAVFSALGNLRDDQVQMEWVEKLSAPDDPVRGRLLEHYKLREEQLKLAAAAALDSFDEQQWLSWSATLDERSRQLPLGGPVLQVMAIERWENAHRLHAAALRNRSKAALHALRIGIKKFRYIVENFLPDLHDNWIGDLKQMQDVLGEVHDLDVLWETARTIHAFTDPDERRRWLEIISRERLERVSQYRERMVGRRSLWQQWRDSLPRNGDLHAAVMKKFETWAFFHDPDFKHTRHVLDMSLTLFDRLAAERLLLTRDVQGIPMRDLLTVAALAHEVGRGHKGKHHKKAIRMLEKLDVPPGWSESHLRVAGLIARYHTGAVPSDSQSKYAALNKSARRVVDTLGGILRLADALDRHHDGAIRRIMLERRDGALVIHARGYEERSRDADRIAAARHLLEIVCGLPIIVRPAQPSV